MTRRVVSAFRRKDGNDDMTNDDSADAAAFSAFRCRPESGFRVARVWIDFVFLSGKDAAAFFAEF